MTKIQKIILGVGAVAAVATAAYVVTKQTKKTYVECDDTDDTVVDDENRDIPKSIQDAADKKATQILAWVIIHREQIEAASVIFGLAGSAFSIVNAIRDFKNGNKMAKQIDEIYEFLQAFAVRYNKDMKSIDAAGGGLVVVLESVDKTMEEILKRLPKKKS